MGREGRGRPTVDAVVFDFGRVIGMDPDRSFFGEIAALMGLAPVEFLHAYAAERHEYDRGTISALEYWTRVAARCGASFDPALVDRIVGLDMDAWFTINPEVVRIVKALRPQVGRLLILSNMNVEGKIRLLGSGRYCGNFDWTTLFDEMIFSCDLFLVKPERAIFDVCAETAGISHDRCLFIDDNRPNVDGALAAGMHALLFEGAGALETALARDFGFAFPET